MAGSRASGSFVFGLLGDTPRMRRTIEFTKELDLDIALFNILAPYPGTSISEVREEKNGEVSWCDFQDFHHTANRMLLRLPDGPSTEVIEAYRRS